MIWKLSEVNARAVSRGQNEFTHAIVNLFSHHLQDLRSLQETLLLFYTFPGFPFILIFSFSPKSQFDPFCLITDAAAFLTGMITLLRPTDRCQNLPLIFFSLVTLLTPTTKASLPSFKLLALSVVFPAKTSSSSISLILTLPFLLKTLMWCQLYYVFMYIHPLLCDKDLHNCRNFHYFPCALLYVSFIKRPLNFFW